MPDAFFEKHGGVALITLNRPEVLNSLGGDLVSIAGEALQEFANDPSVRCVAMTGAGRGFCSGGDVGGMEKGAQARERGEARAAGAWNPIETQTQGMYDLHAKLIVPLQAMLKPTVALVNGPAAGGGMGLALSFDLRVASEKAIFVPAFKDVGQSGDCGVSYHLPRLVGPAKAREMMFFNQRVDAATALDLGLVNKVVPHDKLLEEGLAYCQELANGPTAVYGRMKQNMNFSANSTLQQSLDLEAHNCTMCLHGQDHRTAIQAFLSGQKPVWVGR